MSDWVFLMVKAFSAIVVKKSAFAGSINLTPIRFINRPINGNVPREKHTFDHKYIYYRSDIVSSKMKSTNEKENTI